MYANYLEIAKRIKQIEEELKRLEGVDLCEEQQTL